MSGVEFMTRVEAAKRLNMHPETLKKLVARRLVPFSRPPGTNLTRFTEKDIADIVAMSQVKPTKPGVRTGRGST